MVHGAADVKTKHLLVLEITDERTGDGKMIKPLIEQVKEENGGKITMLYAAEVL